MLLNRLMQFYCVVLSLYNLLNSVVIAKVSPQLLNANRVPLTALTAPGSFYFLEFPVNENDSQLSPICADGSAYSFAFRRGTDEHASKLLIEFEGGPACWNNSSGASCCDSSNLKKQAPWHDYMDYFNDQVVFQKTFPELGSCRGIPSGFLTEAADVVLSNGNAMTNDLPIPLRGNEGKGWWESLGGVESDFRDWSYILIPHCSMDWHLGHQKNPQVTTYCNDGTITEADAVYHRGGTNVDAVIKWVQKQFPSGLDALVTTAGGEIGGCNDSLGPATASSIAPAILASKLSHSENNISPPRSSMLVVTEGSGLWDPDLPSPETMANRWNAIDLPSGVGLPGAMDTLIESSINSTQFIWIASNEEKASDEEKLFFMRQTNIHQDKFHVYNPQSKLEKNGEKLGWCPLYTFPDSDPDVADFFANVIKSMSWSSASSLSTSDSTTKLTLSLSSSASATSSEPRSRLTFLSISILICGIVILSWIIYYIVKAKNSRNGKKVTLSPTDLWFIALTKYPLAFFIVSLLVPIVLSTIAFSQNELRVNMDFDSYLQVNTDLENVRRNYNEAQENQQASLEIEQANCLLHGNSIFGNFRQRKLLDDNIESGDRVDHEDHFVEESLFGNRNLLDELDLDVRIDQKLPLNMLSSHHRELVASNLNYFSGGEWISIMYQNRKGGNVFEPDVLKAIHEFESSIYDFPGFSDYCFGYGVNNCLPIDSIVSYFFNNGELVSNIDAVSRSFLVNQPALWKLDQYFGPDNLQSNVTRSFVFLKNMGGDQSAAHPFLRSFYRDFLLKHDQKKTYPAMVHTWNNFVLKQTEANDALLHDTLWSIGSLCFIAFMILLKVQSVFVVLSSMIGLILAFSVAYYWVSAHFLIQDITLIWVAGIFVMLGIGADDIFLMVDSFDHTKHEFEEEVSVRMFHSDISIGDDDPDDGKKMDRKIEILQKRMIVAYKRAGSMMLVSSVTTAVCFFSNAFGVLTVIQEFGIFMGMVVLINYLHVMTILPSSILVNEIYMASVQKKIVIWFKLKFLPNKFKGVEKNTSPKEPNDAIVEKCFQNKASEGHEKMKNIIEKSSNDMNSLDRYLVQTYAPFVSRRSSYLIGFPILLAIVLGVCGAMNFSMNDGTILLFTSKYNLGRLEKVTDLYFNDDEDVYTTIEEDDVAPTFAPRPQPTPIPQPTRTPEESEAVTIVNATVTINWLSPEEAIEQGKPGAIALPPKNDGTSNSNQAVTNGGSSSQQVGGAVVSSSGNQAPTVGSIPQQTSDTGMRRRETIQVKLIWGVESVGKKSSLWITNTDEKSSEIKNEESSLSSLKLAEPSTQEWLIEVVEMAKTNPQLFVRQNKLTWIERLRDFATYAGVEFPIPEHLFTTYVQMLKLKDPTFAELVQNEIGTSAPGLAGDFTFASVTMMVDGVQAGNAAQNVSMSEQIYNEWTEFAAEANKLSPPEIPKVVAQSSIFLDAYRVEATIDSTLVTWFVANGLCLLVILLFLQNLALSFMVMVTIILILFCLGGLLFAIFRVPFGPVEALGVSIFVGLSANYSLHVVHAYHHSRSANRENKIKEAVFSVGSPIVASALSTMGASAFLFGCRTWVFIELGLLICSITGMALLFTMTFLFAWLASAGPLPIDEYGQGHSHQCDLRVLCHIPRQKGKMSPSINTKSEQPEENRSICSIEMVRNQERNFPVQRKRNKKQAKVAEADDNDSVYSIEIVEDLDDGALQPEKEAENPHYVGRTAADPNDRKTKKTNYNNNVEKTVEGTINIDKTDDRDPQNDEVALRLHVLGS